MLACLLASILDEEREGEGGVEMVVGMYQTIMVK